MRRFLALLATLASLGAGAVPPWTGILDSARAIDWSGKGVSGGIPARATQCGSTISAYTGTAATINTAISNCTAGQHVKLGAGTFNLSSGITFNGRDSVTLRGSGPDSTFLVFTNDDGCLGQGAHICIGATTLGYYAPGTPAHTANWTANYAQGTTVITLDSTTGLSAGMFIVLDQADDTSNPGTDLFFCDAVSVCTDEGGTDYGRNNRGQRQWVQVTNINGSSVTISPGLYAPNWNVGASKNPGAYWGNSGELVSGNGIEDLSVEGNGSAGQANITLIYAFDSWVKNVRSVNAPTPRAHVLLYSCVRCTVRDSYLFGSSSEVTNSLHYGIDMTNTSDNLVENNIIQRRASAMVANGDAGSVWAYNYIIRNQYYDNGSYAHMQGDSYSHEAGNHMILREGNQGQQITGDLVHGTSNLFTYFRNYYIGNEASASPAKTDWQSSVRLYAYNRYYAFIGNVLGEDGTHTTYSALDTAELTIFTLGMSGNSIGTDSVVNTTSMRWGNYDTVTDAVRWCGNSGNTGWTTTCSSTSEVPTGLSKYPNSVPSTETLPSSFYLTSKPAFFNGSDPWPAIGPDISGGSGPGSHVKRIPARRCFEDVMGGAYGDSSPKTFNANSCYYQGGGLLPAPTNLRSRPVWWRYLFDNFYHKASSWLQE